MHSALSAASRLIERVERPESVSINHASSRRPVSASAGPVVGGFLTLLSWRAIFFINLPVGLVALYLLTRVARSPRRAVPFDWIGQVTAVVGMGALTYGLIEGSAEGFGAPQVLTALTVAVVALIA